MSGLARRWLELTSWCHLEVEGEVWWLQGEGAHSDREKAVTSIDKRGNKEEGIVLQETRQEIAKYFQKVRISKFEFVFAFVFVFVCEMGRDG